jgi:hypothetical protein
MIDIDELRSHQTNGCNYNVFTDDIITKLQGWDSEYGIHTSDVSPDAVTVQFDSVPDDTRLLADEIYKFCPDTVTQNFGCYEEMIDAAEEMGQELDPKILDLADGVDFGDDDYGIVLLARSLKRDKIVTLWWD